MSAIQSILAATDFSDDALVAVRRAAVLAGEHRARLQLLHVMHSGALDELRDRLSIGTEVRETLLDDSQRRLDALGEGLREVARSRPECVVLTGNVLDEVVGAADRADLLVLGAHGKSTAHDVLVGTTAERLLLKCRRPMLVAKAESRLPYRTMLVPVDFSVHSMVALRFARDVAPEAHLKIFHAYENPYEEKLVEADVSEDLVEKFRSESREEALANIANMIEKTVSADTRVSSSIDWGGAKFLIPAQAAKLNADLIVMGKHGRSALGEFFLGGVTRATVSRAKCDVLVVPERKGL